MPNIDFERSIFSSRLAKTLNSPDFKHRLLGVKAYLDYEDQDIVRINFLDTLRPELWCIEGLARHLEPLPEQQYGLHLVENLPRLPVQFESLPLNNSAWVLYVQVKPGQEPLDDAYFLKKVRDQIGFGSPQNINVTIFPGLEHTLSIEPPADDTRRGPIYRAPGDEEDPPTLRRGRFITADLSAPSELSDTIEPPGEEESPNLRRGPIYRAPGDQEAPPNIRRGRFIAPTADLSAPGAYSDTIEPPGKEDPPTPLLPLHAVEREGVRPAPGAYSDNQIEMPPAILETGINTVVITALDQRVGAWLFFALLCNYLDRGHEITGYATSLDETEVFAKWSPFVISDQQIAKTYGFQPGHERFRVALQSMHYHVQYDEHAHAWHITPPIFRFDIIHPIDILEDYLVATYYEEASPLPLISVNSMGSQTRRSMLEERLIDYMQVYGARQTIGLLLDSYENLVERMCHDAPERLVHLVNAVNKNREYAVDGSLPPLLRNAAHPSAPLPPATFYLFTETMFLDEQRVAHSRWKMGILLVGPDHPFNNAHTLLDALCFHLHLDYTLKRSTNQALIPGRQMTVSVGDTPVGQLGEVHPEVLTRWELFYPASFIELDLDAITKMWVGEKA